MGYVSDGRLPIGQGEEMRPRLRETLESWSRGDWAGEAEDEMRADQLSSLRKLVAVIDACVRTGRSLQLR